MKKQTYIIYVYISKFCVLPYNSNTLIEKEIYIEKTRILEGLSRRTISPRQEKES